MWNPTEIMSILYNGLQRLEADFCEQHAYQGLDSYTETQLHPLLAQAFANDAATVLREVRYPSALVDLPKDSHRQRCDLVLIPKDKSRIFDIVDEQVAQNKAIGTLFESQSTNAIPDIDQSMPEDAYWIEVKSVAQFSYIDGVPVANGKYTTDLLSGPRNDLVKLAVDPLIQFGCVLVLLFHEEQIAGSHDLAVVSNSILNQELPMGLPEIESFPIADRGGNSWCTVGLLPVKL